jgi:Lon protease-like protein
MRPFEEIPEGWPPPGGAQTLIAPVFPLPRAWLFPHVVLPLHVFEPRYRQMVADCLDGPGRIVLGTIAAGFEHEHLGEPPLEPIGGLGEIGRHEQLPDGTYHVFLVGLARVRIREVESDRLYRKVEAEPIEESAAPTPETAELRREVCDAILARVDDIKQVPEQVPLGALVDFLALRLQLPHEQMQLVYNETDPTVRARTVLRAHGGG